MKSVIIIPARMASNRLPGKPMIEVAGKPLVWWTYEQARRTKANAVLIATPDREIARYCSDHGMPWRPTKDDHPSGTHRCAEVASQFKEENQVDVIVNWQVDEVEVDPEDVNRLVKSMDSTSDIHTLVGQMQSTLMDNPNVTKAICFRLGRKLTAHWFSRAPMAGSLAHIGIYAFTPTVLWKLSLLTPSPFSLAESLEQLTWIEDGWNIRALVVEKVPLAINTPEDLEEFRRKMESCSSKS